jgi:glycosyltransferase involved in cell wall biosynthesis
VVVPSRREGYGVVAREAMAWGRPVVASRVGGLADAVEDDATGLLVPPGDVATLRAAVVGLLDDPERRARLGAAGRAQAPTFAAAADATVALYESVARRTT